MIEVVAGLLLAGAVIGGVVLSRKGRREAWKAAGDRLGLEFHKATFLGSDTLSGRNGGFRVVFDTFTRSHGKSSSNYTRVVVHADGAFTDSLKLKREGFGSSVKKLFVGDDIEVADVSFDGDVLVEGNETEAVARLDQHTRALLQGWLTTSGVTTKVEDGEVYWERHGTMRDRDEIVATVMRSVTVATALASGRRPLSELLAGNAVDEPAGPVRRRNAQLLFDNYADSPSAKALARELIEPGRGDDELSLLAAIALGLEGHPAVTDLLESHHSLSPDSYCRGLEHLASQATGAPRTASLLVASLDHPAEMVQRSAVRALELGGRLGDVQEQLLALAPAASESATAAVLAGALGHLEPSPDLEAVLLGLLDDDHGEVKVAAARSLALVGSIAAVEPLLPLTKGLLTSGELKSAARGAVEAIQSRVGEVQPGRLSVIAPAPEAGGLSSPVADDDGGQLSLGKPPSAEEDG